MASKITAYSLEGRIFLGFDNKSLKAANAQISREMARMQQHTIGASNTFKGLMGASGAAFGAVAGGMAIGAASASKFEEAFVRVKKTLNISKDVKDVDKAFKQIADQLINLSKITPITTDELTEIAAVGGQLGVAASDIVEFTKVIQKLTIATNLGAEDAALAMARLQEITGTATNQLDNLGATLVDLGNNFAATESEIVNSAMQIATATAQIAGDTNNAAVDSLAFATALRAIGQPAQAGATAIVRLMTEASQAVQVGGEDLELFARVARMGITDFVRLFEVDSTRALALFIKGLDNMSGTGLTNIEVLRQLGLGQVRSRKAILALSKAHETLFDAIETGNRAYIENVALNEEAERRYDTLAMKIQQLKNIVGASILGFAEDTDSLGTAKNIIEDITNLTYQMFNNMENFLRFTTNVVSPFMLLRTITRQMTRNIQEGAVAMGVFENAAKGASAMSGILKSQYKIAGGGMTKADDLEPFGMRAFQGGVITGKDRFAGMVPGILGGLFGLQTGKARRQSDLARQAFFMGRPGADMAMRGITPKDLGLSEKVGSLTGLLDGKGAPIEASFEEVNEELGDYWGRIAAQNRRVAGLARQSWHMMLMGMDPERDPRIESGGGMKTRIESVKGRARSKEFSRLVDKFYGGRKGLGIRGAFGAMGRKGSALRGFDVDFMKHVEASRVMDLDPEVSIKDLEKKFGFKSKMSEKNLRGLAQAFDIASAKSLKFAGILRGLVGGFGAMAAVMAVVAPLIKMFANRGGEARGMEDFKNSIFEISNGYREMANNITLVKEAERLLSEERGIFGETEIAATLSDYVDNQLKAINQTQTELAKSFGKSFVENIFLKEVSAGKGGLGKLLIDMMGDAGMGTEQQIIDQWSKPVGRAIQSIVEEGRIPEVKEAFDDLVLAKDGVLSAFFTGDTRDAVWSAVRGGVKDGGSGSLLEFFGDLSGPLDRVTQFGIAQEQIFDTATDFWKNYVGSTSPAKKAEKDAERIQSIISGTYFSAGYQGGYGDYRAQFGVYSGDENLRQEGMTGAQQLDEYLKTIAEAIKKYSPDITDAALADSVLEIFAFMQAANSLLGGDFSGMAHNALLDETSDIVQAAGEMAEAQLDLLVTAGELSEGDYLDVKGSPAEALKLYAETMSEINAKVLEETKNVQEALGVTEEMSLRLAYKMKEAFKEIRKAAANLGKPIEEAFGTEETMGSLLVKLREQRQAVQDLERDLNKLRASGFEMSADRIMAMGISGRHIAELFLSDFGMAQQIENELIRTSPASASELGVPSPIVDENYLQDLENMGFKMSESFVLGMKDGFPMMEAAFRDMGQLVVDTLNDAFDFGSPSKVMFQRGVWSVQGYVNGVRSQFNDVNRTGMEFGEEYIDGVMRGIEFGTEDFMNSISALGVDPYWFLGNLFTQGAPLGDWDNARDVASASILNFAQKHQTSLQKTWSMVTALTNADRQRTQALLGVNQAKQSYASQLRQEASLEDRLTRTREKLNKLEIEGRAGNVTVDERAGILSNLISLRDMEKRAKGEYTAREALNIQKKEQEVQTMARMFDQGVIDQLTFQAAQEELAEMKGEFKTPEDKELFFLQLAQAQETYDKSIEDSLKISDELVATREEYFKLLDEQENMTLLVATAQDGYNAALEGWVDADLAVGTAMLNFQTNLVPSQIDTLLELQGHYGGVTGEIGAMFEAMSKGGAKVWEAMGFTDSTSYSASFQQGFKEFAESFMPGIVTIPNPAKSMMTPTQGAMTPSQFIKKPFANKYGGRHPAKGYAMGGRDYGMRRALVGEYGPEEVRFVPGSGFLVKPLSGGRGKGTVVENLSVNVTGVPVDNASARKAAIQIKKALQRLDREGNAGGGIRNT